MDEDKFIRAKFTFGAKCKLSKLDKALDTSFSSIKNLRKRIFKHFPEVQDMVEPSPSTHLLSVKCKDTVGDYVTLDNEDDLDAMEVSLCSNLEFSIEITPIALPSAADRASDASCSSNRQSGKAPLAMAKTTECRYFQSRGFCTNGDNCRFAHNPVAQDSHHNRPEFQAKGPVFKRDWSKLRHDGKRDWSTLRHDGDYNYWIAHHSASDSATNIEYLSGEIGYPTLSKFVNQRNLPHQTIALFVKLLAREEIRTSLLRQNTNKIYGVLTGSPFLMELKDHITSHVGVMPTLKPQDLKPYLAFTEELQSRTMEGWKQVPLNELKAVVSKLEECTGKDDIVAIVSRLSDQKGRVQRLLAVAPPEQQQCQGEEFRTMSIVPEKEELVDFQAKQKLPVNRIGLQYSNVNEYLETHFRLLRADCIDPLRQGIKAYRSSERNTTGDHARHSERSSVMLDLRVYTEVQLAGIRCGDQGVEFLVSFHVPATERTTEKWESSKKLMFGALLCISSDQFQTFFWGVVARRDVKELAKGLISIRLIGASDAIFTQGLEKGWNSSEPYVMVESTASYFEAYYHVLKTLQRKEMENIPFTPYLLHLEPRVSPPSYLQRRRNGDEYDFSCSFPEIYEELGKTCIRIMESEWPSGWADSLDRAQLDALKQGLTRELAIIQGPPGTGKTFLGLILVKILLANLNQRRGYKPVPRSTPIEVVEPEEEVCDFSGSILIICYTNHALDQFL
ncbi:unnamed protein product [Calypogeia fissa]